VAWAMLRHGPIERWRDSREDAEFSVEVRLIAIAAIDGDAGPVHLIAPRYATDDRSMNRFAP
jgi:hypothetical protein